MSFGSSFDGVRLTRLDTNPKGIGFEPYFRLSAREKVKAIVMRMLLLLKVSSSELCFIKIQLQCQNICLTALVLLCIRSFVLIFTYGSSMMYWVHFK